MKVLKVFYIPEVEVEFTREDVVQLMLLSVRHYDGKCRSLSQPGGLIYGLNNSLPTPSKFTEWSRGTVTQSETKDETATWVLKTADVGLLAKICEMGDAPREFYFSQMLSRLNDEYERLNP